MILPSRPKSGTAFLYPGQPERGDSGERRRFSKNLTNLNKLKGPRAKIRNLFIPLPSFNFGLVAPACVRLCGYSI